jgi:hypothetical protein
LMMTANSFLLSARERLYSFKHQPDASQ